MLNVYKTQDRTRTFSSSNVLVEVKVRESCSFSVSRDLMFSVDFSLTYKLFKHNSLLKFDNLTISSARGKNSRVRRKYISLAVLQSLDFTIRQPYMK